jgi:hypothetical protein
MSQFILEIWQISLFPPAKAVLFGQFCGHFDYFVSFCTVANLSGSPGSCMICKKVMAWKLRAWPGRIAELWPKVITVTSLAEDDKSPF